MVRCPEPCPEDESDFDSNCTDGLEALDGHTAGHRHKLQEDLLKIMIALPCQLHILINQPSPFPPKKIWVRRAHIDMHTVPQLEPRDKMANDIDEMTWPDFIIGWPWVC